MKLTDLFRRLVSHFSSSNRSDPDTKEAKQKLNTRQQQSTRSPSSSTNQSKPSTATTITNIRMPGVTTNTSSKYDQIPGPLGPNSNSLHGKVALVTGAGTYNILAFLTDGDSKLGLHPISDLHARRWAVAAGASALLPQLKSAGPEHHPHIPFMLHKPGDRHCHTPAAS